MCFYNDDCDWIANVTEETFSRADKEHRCYECGNRILTGEWYRHIHQQESESCLICEDLEDYGDLYDPQQDPKTCEHNYGEHFDCNICRECCLILEAIRDLEEKEGCPPYARQPRIGELSDELHEHKRCLDFKYHLHARELFPELVENKLCALA